MTGALDDKQRAAARQLSLAAYLMPYTHAGEGQPKDEAQIQNRILFYGELMRTLLEQSGPEHAHDAFRTQLGRDVEALASAGIRVEVSYAPEDQRRLYRLRSSGYSPGELEFTDAERAVLQEALATFATDFPYSVPLHLALYNLMDGLQPDASSLPVEAPYDEELSRALARLDVAISRCKAVIFDYYAISSDKVSTREIEPYALSLISGAWYLTGRDCNREEVRQFRLSRIRGNIKYAKPGGANEYEIPDLDPAIYGPRAPWRLDEPQTEAKIFLACEQGELLERAYPGAGDLQCGDGGVLYRTSYAGERRLISTVLWLGGGAQVLAPPELVQRTVACLRSLVEEHGPNAPAPAPVEQEGCDSPRRSRDRRKKGKVEPVRPELELALARYAARMELGEDELEASVPLEQLSKKFGCSEREIKNALQSVIELSDNYRPEIVYVIEHGNLVKCVQDPDRAFRRPFRISPLQGRAALLALDLISETADPDLIDRLREKVRRVTGGEPWEISTDERQADDPLVADIHTARRQNCLLRIRYPSGGRVKQREVEPARMISAHGSWYLSAYCRDASESRLFRLDRILQTEVLEQQFGYRPGVETPDDPSDVHPEAFATERAEIRFSAKVARWMDGRPELELKRNYADGSRDYTLYYADLSWAASRVMLYRGEAAVIKPRQLREEVRHRSQALLDAHETPG